MNIKASENKKLKANIVVLGSGGGGLAAAVAAAEMGSKDILVLEKRQRLGGNTALATGLFGCESPVQKRAMIECRADDCFQIAMRWAHWKRVDPFIVRAYLDKSGDTIRWLEEKGLEFELLRLYPNQMPVWHRPAGGGARLVEILTRNCEDMGVQIRSRTSGKKILRSGDGEVVGVWAVSQGEEFQIEAKKVIIATGGFSGNKEMLSKYCPGYHPGMQAAAVHLAGDGLLMAAEAGAAIAESIPLLKGGPGPDTSWEKMGNLRNIVKDPFPVWVNKKGRRFIDEAAGFMDFESVNAVLQQPDKVCYALIDDTLRQEMEERGFLITPTGTRSAAAEKRGAPGLQKELEDKTKENKGNLVKISDSWDEVAQWIGADAGVLKATIEEYNTFCDRGHDAVFVKDRRYLRPLRRPPYYAIRCSTGFHDTMGGIKVNERMEVLDTEGNPIPGLFAAGVLPDGWESDTYCSVLCGSAFGFAINSGRIAGESAAKYLMS